MRDSREDMASGEKGSKTTEVASKKGNWAPPGYEFLNEFELRDGREANEIILSCLQENEAPRCGVLGDTGTGKTASMRGLIRDWLVKVPKGVVFIVDDKGARSAFEGQERATVASLKLQPPAKEPRIIIFRGDRFDRLNGEVDPETVADLQWRLAQQERPSLGVYDELAKAMTFGQWKTADSSVKWVFTKGRDVQAGAIWGAQETQMIAAEAFNQSANIKAFRMPGNPVRLLRERNYCDGGVDKIIARLPGDDLPRQQRGYYVLLRRGKEWNRVIYRDSKVNSAMKTQGEIKALPALPSDVDR